MLNSNRKNTTTIRFTIQQKEYYKLYLDRQLPIYLVGINNNSQQRAIDGWVVNSI
ncbi:MAG: hypothetical protein ACHQUC_02490 [Chlamydiales bacterium]